MNRRKFIVSSLALAAVPGLLSLEGCPVTQSQIADLVAEVGAGLAQLLPYFKSVSAATEAKIEASFAALEAAVQGWKPGAAIAVIEQAVNAFVANMNLIPVLATYQPLVQLIVATVEGILTLVVPPTAGRVGLVANAPKTAKAFRAAWNKQIATQPSLARLTLN